MDISSYGYALAALLHAGLAIRCARLGRPSASTFPYRLLVGALAATSAWAVLAAIAQAVNGPSTLAAGLLDLTRYATWYALLLVQLESPARERLRLQRLRIVGTSLVVIQAALMLLRVLPTASIEEWLGRSAFVVALALPLFGLLVTEQLWRNAADESRWAAKPFCLALVLLFGFDFYFYSYAALFNRFEPDSLRIRGFVHALCVPLLYVAVRRQSQRTTGLALSRSAAFHTATLLLAGLYLLLLSGVSLYVRRFGGDWGSSLQLALLIVAVVALCVMLLSGSLRAKVRVLIAKNFFSYRYDYRSEWLRFTSMLSASTEPGSIRTSVIRGLADMVESPAGALWLRGAVDGGLAQLGRWNMPASPHVEPVDSALCRFLEHKGWIIDVDECRSLPRRYDGLAAPEWLLSLPSCWLIVPLPAGDGLIGFVVLARPRTRVVVDWEVRDLLKTASRQAAAFLEQMRATEALLEARKFEAFNRMSAFVVHDLKNIVTQLSLMMKNARRLQDNPEFRQDMLETVEHSLDKMRQLMLQLREGEAPLQSGSSGAELVSIARRLEASARQRGRTVEVRAEGSLTSRGNEQRIERVLGHLLQNALDATREGQRVWIALQRQAGHILVTVGDSGAGMSEDFVKTHLFKPFATTKAGGMGIGAYESFQYVKELGGSVEVESAPGQGTIFRLRLPPLETSEPRLSHAAASLASPS